MNNTIELPTDYQNFIALSRYARWLPEEGRRETWTETVNRYLDFMENHLKKEHNFDLSYEIRSGLFEHIAGLGVMPSMRALMTAGNALDRCHVAGYNC